MKDSLYFDPQEIEDARLEAFSDAIEELADRLNNGETLDQFADRIIEEGGAE
jgi:hypothetical protein